MEWLVSGSLPVSPPLSALGLFSVSSRLLLLFCLFLLLFPPCSFASLPCFRVGLLPTAFFHPAICFTTRFSTSIPLSLSVFWVLGHPCMCELSCEVRFRFVDFFLGPWAIWFTLISSLFPHPGLTPFSYMLYLVSVRFYAPISRLLRFLPSTFTLSLLGQIPTFHML